MSRLAAIVAALRADAARGEALLRDLLLREPDNAEARVLLSDTLRRRGDAAGALREAETAVKRAPQAFATHRQQGLVLAEMNDTAGAISALRAATKREARHPSLWRELGDQLLKGGDRAAAEEAFSRHASMPRGYPQFARAADALRARRGEEAAALLSAYLERAPNDVVAMRLIAEAHAFAGLAHEAEAWLRRSLALAPVQIAARHMLAQLLLEQGRPQEAHAEVRLLMRQNPGSEGPMRLLGATLNALGDYEDASKLYERLLKSKPREAPTWLTYGHTLKVLGRTEQCIQAYRKCLEIEPAFGEACWALANIKPHRFSDAEVAQMQAQLQGASLSPMGRISVNYALGKALEDRGDADAAFAAYAEGAALLSKEAPYDPDGVHAFVARSRAQFTPAFFAARAGQGEPAQDPIFVVGLPRSGSTLIEQILASHSQVEGTSELSDLSAIADRIGAGGAYLDVLASLDAAALRGLGQAYLDTTRAYRKLGRPLFINKLPGDFRHIGLIQLILPNAKIIDVRRHPMACGWSCFKQLFARGSGFSNDLGHIGRYYADYVALVQHYDAVLPGRVHRVIHEDLVADPETQIRALLDYCGLPFEAACLRPHETKRAIRTPSAEQVRQPINAAGVEAWRPYETHLAPLARALGPVLENWRS
ncbi:tetratricopeptide repeat-containing sulfotransferase family protein [Terricaulis sp.]|uniref:tetratricopeptide repeat-containing sulfotransferase family protein n=1 Tax=Terricaulis sp. TaxID=2768686 RepID=UPI0037850752